MEYNNSTSIKKSLYDLVSIESVARVIWTGEKGDEIRNALAMEMGSAEASSVCNAVNRHILTFAFANVACELEQPGILNIRAVLTALKGLVIFVRALSTVDAGNTNVVPSAEMLYVRIMAHSALHCLLASNDINNGYALAFKILSKDNHVNQPTIVSQFRSKVDHFIKSCAQVGLEHGRKSMAIKASEFEIHLPVAKLVADLRTFVSTNRFNKSFQQIVSSIQTTITNNKDYYL